MKLSELFMVNLGQEFEESVRIDRERKESLGATDHPLQTYCITNQAAEFLTEFFEHVLGKSKKMRKGANHWIYGYYGSGKSHLLTVLSFLIDSKWIEKVSKKEVWHALSSNINANASDDFQTLHQLWTNTLDKYRIVPISVNLLRYQGIEEQSFSNMILKAAHEKQNLSSRLEVAYFERWYRDSDSWSERNQLVRKILQEYEVKSASKLSWEDVKKYEILSKIVLPKLFERETGTRDGLEDLKPSKLDSKEVVTQLEEWRREIEHDSQQPVKLVLLLDEISLFIGDNPDKLTELIALAEQIDEIGKGNIQLVTTAQEKIEEVQPEYAAKEADFSILKDRFPHRYSLPSRHVSEIVQRRLLSKTEKGAKWIQSSILKNSRLHPESTFTYTEIGQNISPELDQIEKSEFINFYPFLPYLPSLCLEILSSLRKKAPDPAKSIFSGTARAILAVADGLLKDWVPKQKPYMLLNLIDFYNLIEPEIRDILPQKVKIIKEIEQDVRESSLREIDLKVAKAILLLHQVPEFVPLSEENLAVSVMSDLNGSTRNQMVGQIGDSLDRLKKYVRTSRKTDQRLRFTDIEERRIYEKAREYKEDQNWEKVIEELDNQLMDEIIPRLPLPNLVSYSEDEEGYPVLYKISIEDYPLSKNYGSADGLRVPITIHGLIPNQTDPSTDQGTLNWYVGEEGIKELRDRLIGWWSLYTASEGQATPTVVQQDLKKKANHVVDGISSVLKSGSYQVREKTLSNLNEAVEECVSQIYPVHFHPQMLKIDKQQLTELKGLERGEPLPEWAITIQVATEAPKTYTGNVPIQNKVRALAGKALKKNEDELSILRLTDLIVDEEPIYEQTKPALYALLWGLCRKGDFRLVDEEGHPVENEILLRPDQHAEIRIRIASEREDLQQLLEEQDFLGTTDPFDEGLVRLRKANQKISRKSEDLIEKIQLTKEDLTKPAVEVLVSSFEKSIKKFQEKARSRIEAMDSDKPKWEEIIVKTADADEWLESVDQRWALRSKYIVHLDGLLNLAHQSHSWIDATCKDKARRLEKELEKGKEIDWWAEGEWQRLTSLLDTRSELLSKLTEGWIAFIQEEKMEDLYEKLEKHKWIIPLRKLPTVLHPGFKREYLRPLRQFKSAYKEAHTALETLFSNLDQINKSKLERALHVLRKSESLPKIEEVSASNLRKKLEKLSNVVGNQNPQIVTAVGIWPEDRDGLRKNIQNLKTTELETKRVNGGIIIQ